MASLSNFTSYAGYKAQLVANSEPSETAFIRQYYKLLNAYYNSNGLYPYIAEELEATLGTDASLLAIRNPAWRVVQVYASKIVAGNAKKTLNIETENKTLAPAIHKIWKWSNFQSKKQAWVREFAIFGDMFLRIQTKTDENEKPASVFISNIKPENVGDFTLDERGFITKIRIDIPIVVDGESFTYTELWDKEEGSYEVWEQHDGGLEAELGDIGTPTSSTSIEELTGDNFIPIVYQPFRDDGSGRGSSVFGPVIEKIDEVNRKATRLSQMGFRYNRPLFVATTTGTDKAGRPLPKPDFDEELDADGAFLIGDDDLVVLPTMTDVKSLVPNVKYDDMLAMVKDDMAELIQDLPELSYYMLKSSDLSGVAIRFLLDDLISRVLEARANFEQALIKAQEMALTIAVNAKLIEGLTGVFIDGDFDHEFSERDVLPLDLSEIVSNIKTLTDAGASVYASAKASGMSEKASKDLAQVDDFGYTGLADPSRRIVSDDPESTDAVPEPEE